MIPFTHTSHIRSRAIVAVLTLLMTCALPGCWNSGSSSEGDGSGEAGLSESDLNAQRDARFGSGSIPTAEGEGMFRDIHFGYDSYAVEDDGRSDLDYNVRVLQQQSDLSVTLEGHCDERGTVEYNMALGAERARAVKNALVAQGIASSRIETISYGEEVPLDMGHDEAAYARNRRVHFSASAKAGGRARGTTQY